MSTNENTVAVTSIELQDVNTVTETDKVYGLINIKQTFKL